MGLLSSPIGLPDSQGPGKISFLYTDPVAKRYHTVSGTIAPLYTIGKVGAFFSKTEFNITFTITEMNRRMYLRFSAKKKKVKETQSAANRGKEAAKAKAGSKGGDKRTILESCSQMPGLPFDDSESD